MGRTKITDARVALSGIVQHPLLPKPFIMKAFRPGSPIVSDAPLRTLKRNGFVSAGIEMPVRGTSGKLHGRGRLYCALNRDAARLVRIGNEPQARKAAREAEAIEESSLGKAIAAILAEVGTGEDSWQVYLSAGHDVRFLEKLGLLSEKIDRVRDKLGLSAGLTVSTGEVVAFHGPSALIATTDGSQLPVSRERLSAQGVNWLGAPVIINREDDANMFLVELEPGVRLDAPGRARAKSGAELPLLAVGARGEVPEKADIYRHGGFSVQRPEAADAFEVFLAQAPAH